MVQNFDCKGAFRLDASNAKRRLASGDLREWSLTSLAKVANLRKWLLIFATGHFIGPSTENLP